MSEQGEMADSDQSQRAAAAAARPEGDLAPVFAGVVEAVASAHEAFKLAKLRVLASDCAGCGLDSATMRFCRFNSDEECKHLSILAHRAAMASRLARMKHGGVPEDFWPVVAGDRIAPGYASVAAVRRLLADEMRVAILLGTPGAGKSLAGALAVAERGGVFSPGSALATCGQKSRHGDKANDLLERLYVSPMVVLDDVGSGQSATPGAVNATEDVLRVRYDNRLPTVVTSNLLPEAFWSLFGGECGRVASRIGGANKLVFCTEPDRRNPRPFSERGER